MKNVTMKIAKFGKKKAADLLQIQAKLEEELEELRIEKIKLNKKISAQKEVVANSKMFGDALVNDENEKLKSLCEDRNDIRERIKDVYESLESIATILERREKTKTAKSARKYGALGTFGVLGGIVLSYGSDTFGTLLNKKTLDATKTAMVRFIPKLL